jgi:hypothetical protein
MLVKTRQHHRPQIFLLRLQIKRVRGAFDNFEFVLDALFGEGVSQYLRLAHGHRRVRRAVQDEKWRILRVEIRRHGERSVQFRRVGARLSQSRDVFRILGCEIGRAVPIDDAIDGARLIRVGTSWIKPIGRTGVLQLGVLQVTEYS